VARPCLKLLVLLQSMDPRHLQCTLGPRFPGMSTQKNESSWKCYLQVASPAAYFIWVLSKASWGDRTERGK
jgi:hypothetical protein